MNPTISNFGKSHLSCVYWKFNIDSLMPIVVDILISARKVCCSGWTW